MDAGSRRLCKSQHPPRSQNRDPSTLLRAGSGAPPAPRLAAGVRVWRPAGQPPGRAALRLLWDFKPGLKEGLEIGPGNRFRAIILHRRSQEAACARESRPIDGSRPAHGRGSPRHCAECGNRESRRRRGDTVSALRMDAGGRGSLDVQVPAFVEHVRYRRSVPQLHLPVGIHAVPGVPRVVAAFGVVSERVGVSCYRLATSY